MSQKYLCILSSSSRSQGLTGTPFLSKLHKFAVGLEQRHREMGMSLGLHSKSCTAAGFLSLLAFGVFNLVNGKSTEGYGYVGSWEEITPLPRSSAEARAAGDGFGQFMERGKWMGIFSDMPRLSTGILCGCGALWQSTESLQCTHISQQMAVSVHPRHLSQSLLWRDFKLMLFVLLCSGMVGPACVTGEGCPGKEQENGEWKSISVWIQQNTCLER